MNKNSAFNFSADVIKGIIDMSLCDQRLKLPEDTRAFDAPEGSKTYLMFAREFGGEGPIWVLVAADLLVSKPPAPVGTAIVDAGNDEADHVLVELSAAVEPAFFNELFDSDNKSEDQQKLIRMLMSDPESIWLKM